jgi:bidirectional [NiFe] hydrogenase diaphorase subunit
MASIVINGRQMDVEEDITVLEAARNEGIDIPTLCYHKALKPYGGCKLCIVESEGPNLRKMMRPSCILKVSEGLLIETDSLRIATMRKELLSLYLSLSPRPRPYLVDMANKYGAKLITPEAGADLCSRCTLCVRVCREKIGASALTLAKKDGPATGASRLIRFIREACFGGGTCASICPSGILRMEDSGAERTMMIRGRPVGIFELAECETCGAHYVTPQYLDKVQSRLSMEEGKIIKKVCPECARRYYTVALTGQFICGEH